MNSFVIPPKLEKGDKIRIISPSGKIDKNVILDAAKVIEKWGFEVEISENAFAEHGRYAGTDSQRATDIENAFKDKSVKAILCSRGGYGIVRLIGLIDENVIKSNPKWLLGYSDVTALHQILLKNGIASLHCQMARAISDNPESLPVVSILSVINGGKYSVELENTHKLNKTGHVTAEICGGNLAVKIGRAHV